MNWDLMLLLIFFLIVYLFYLTHKKRFEVQGKIFFLYKTKFGLKLMEKLSRICPKTLNFIGTVGIITGFLGMIFIFVTLLQMTLKLILQPSASPGLVPVLPGVKVSPLLPVLGFWHWIIIIFIVALIHEFSHGIFARLYNIKIKSSGFAFFGPIPAAFVEPDENQLKKKSRRAQLSILSAGAFSNIIMAFFVLFLMLFIFFPINQSLIEPSGIYIASVKENYPANMSGLPAGSMITGINSLEVKSSEKLLDFIKDNGNEFTINTNSGDYLVKPILEEDRFVVGIETIQLNDYRNKNILTSMFGWFLELLKWLWIISLGIGLFNLLPLGPVDGGRMFPLGLSFFVKDENKIKKIWKYISFLVLGLIIINLLPYIINLFVWIISLF